MSPKESAGGGGAKELLSDRLIIIIISIIIIIAVVVQWGYRFVSVKMSGLVLVFYFFFPNSYNWFHFVYGPP